MQAIQKVELPVIFEGSNTQLNLIFIPFIQQIVWWVVTMDQRLGQTVPQGAYLPNWGKEKKVLLFVNI